MFNKNITLLLLGLLLILVLLMILYLASNNNNKTGPQTSPLPSAARTISPFPTQTIKPEEQLEKQTQADINYTEAQDKVLRDFPWYNNLPLQEKNYFVLFDLSKNEFRAKIYPQESSDISIEDQVKSYQQEILGKLNALGIDTATYQIEWSINPE